jgi:hypothetical protein
MTEFNHLLAEIHNEYANLDERSKKELTALLRNLQRYLVLQPDSGKIRLIRRSIQKRIQQEIGKTLNIDEFGILAMQKLRNEIVHNRKVNSNTLLRFGNWIWKEIGNVYSDDVLALFNTLSYSIRSERLPRLESNYSAYDVAFGFLDIYKSKSDVEKAAIVRNLIPLIFPKFKQKFLKTNVMKGKK